MGKKDAAPRKANPSSESTTTNHTGPHLSMNPSWRVVQGGDEELIGQTRVSVTNEVPLQGLEQALGANGPLSENGPLNANRLLEIDGGYRPLDVNRPLDVYGPSDANRASNVSRPSNVNRLTDVNKTLVENRPALAKSTFEGAENRGNATGESMWFPHLRKEGHSIAQKGYALVHNLMHPEGVRLRNRGVQVGESFIPLEKEKPAAAGPETPVLSEEKGDSLQGRDHENSDMDGKPGSKKTAEPSLEPERKTSGFETRLNRRPSSDSNAKTPLHRTESASGSGFVRRVEIQIQDNGEIKAEEIWHDAGNDLGDPPNEFRRQLSKIPSDIIPEPQGNVCVLSIDGGGVRGLIPALVLARLEGMLQEKSGNPDARIADYFDLIAGTSVGGLLAVMLLTPNEHGRPLFSAAEAATFIKNNCPMIFYKHWLAGLRQIFKPKYSTKPLERVLDYYLTEPWETPLTLKHLLKPCLITSYDLSRAAPRFFVRRLAQLSDSHDFTLRDVCRATAAAPSFFKPADIASVDGTSKAVCADGGIIANNPTLAAVNHLIVNREEFPRTSLTGRRLVLSLGAGEGVDTYDYKQARNWGSLGWAMPVMNMMLWGNGNTVDFIMTLFSEALSTAKAYLRIEVKHLTGTTKQLDNSTPANIAALEQLTEEALARKAVTLDGSGFARELNQTYGERLEEFADDLIAEADARKTRPQPTVRLAAPARARLREDLRGKKVDRGGTFLSWRKHELPVGARPTNPGDTY